MCYSHGGAAGQVRAKAAARVALADVLAHGEHRDPWVILEDALHTCDALMGQAKIAVADGDPVTPEQVEALTGAVERAARLARLTLDAGLAERRTRVQESRLEAFSQGLGVFIAALGLSDEQRARIPQGLRAMRRTLTPGPAGVVDGEVVTAGG